jgi:hypothetical protein
MTTNTGDKNISLDNNLITGGKTRSQAIDTSLTTTLPKKKAWVKPKQTPQKNLIKLAHDYNLFELNDGLERESHK